MKKVILSMFAICSISSFASNTSSFDVSVTTTSGCSIQMSDIHLGVLEGIIEGGIKPVHLNVACTKNTPYEIKTTVAQGIESPDQDGHYFKYIYPLYHNTDPVDREFIGYRFKGVDKNYSSHPNLNYFGDGTTNDQGSNTMFIKGIGTGAFEKINFNTEYYTYIPLKAGDYTASHSFTITY